MRVASFSIIMATLTSQAFLERWLSFFDAKKKNLTSLSAERYSEFSDLVKVARSKQVQKSSSEYNAVKHFDILTIGDVEKLIKKRNTEADPILYFVTNEELAGGPYPARTWWYQQDAGPFEETLCQHHPRSCDAVHLLL